MVTIPFHPRATSACGVILLVVVGCIFDLLDETTVVPKVGLSVIAKLLERWFARFEVLASIFITAGVIPGIHCKIFGKLVFQQEGAPFTVHSYDFQS